MSERGGAAGRGPVGGDPGGNRSREREISIELGSWGEVKLSWRNANAGMRGVVVERGRPRVLPISEMVQLSAACVPDVSLCPAG